LGGGDAQPKEDSIAGDRQVMSKRWIELCGGNQLHQATDFEAATGKAFTSTGVGGDLEECNQLVES
jgi:hypothetical protein